MFLSFLAGGGIGLVHLKKHKASQVMYTKHVLPPMHVSHAFLLTDERRLHEI